MYSKILLISILAIGFVQSFDGFKKTTECQEVKEASIAALPSCTFDVIDFEQAGIAVVESSLTGQLNTVVKGYCDQSRKLLSCFKSLSVEARGCLETSYSAVFGNKKSEEVLNNLCENDGAKIIAFVNDGGVQCWNDKVLKIEECAAGIPEASTKNGVIDECKARQLTGACVVNSLKECASPTPSNLLELFFSDITC